jgi:methyl-accepting chemotaxis protein
MGSVRTAPLGFIMRIFDNLSIALKTIVGPVVSALVMTAALGAFFWSNSQVQQSNLILDHASEAARSTDQALFKFTEGHSDLLRALAWQTLKVDPTLVTEAFKKASDTIAESGALLADNAPAITLVPELGSKARTALGDYRLSTQTLVEALQQDLFLASMMAAETQQKAAAVNSSIRAIVSSVHERERQARANADAIAAASVVRTTSATIAGMVLSLIIALGLARALSRPIAGITTVMERLAVKDFAISVPAQERRDEVGAMARTVAIFKDRMENAQRMEQAAAEEAAAKEQRRKVLEGAIVEFESAIETKLSAVAASVDVTKQIADVLSGSANGTSRQSAAATSASEQTSVNVQTVAGSTEELSASIAEISKRVMQAAKIAAAADSDAQNAVTSVSGLLEAAGKIGSVITLIEGVAGRTNLLALNATIEAARAGDAGKGFAVVAAEVKGLANQTASATKEISAHIGSIQEVARGFAETIGAIGHTTRQISEISATIASSVEEQSAATQEIARNTQEAALGTSKVAGHINDVAGAVDATGRSAQQLRTASAELTRNSDALRSGVSSFLNTIRAA